MIGCLLGIGALVGVVTGLALIGVAIAMDPLWGSVIVAVELLVVWRLWKRFVRWLTENGRSGGATPEP